MDPSLVFNLLERFSGNPLRIELHGGEPLLYPRLRMRQLVSILENAENVVGVSMQTNGTLLDEDWLRIFSPISDRFELGVSLDGPGGANSWRIDHHGRPAFSTIVKGLNLLERMDVRSGVIAVVTKQSLRDPAQIVEFVGKFKNVRLLKFVPCFDFGVQQAAGPTRSKAARDAADVGSAFGEAWAISPAEYADFLGEAYHAWMASGATSSLVVEPFLAVAQAVLGSTTETCTFSTTKCRHVVTLYPDGSVGACDELDKRDAALDPTLQNINLAFEGCAASAVAKERMRRCAGCLYFTRCKGGCIATRQRFHRVGREEEYCNYRRALIDFMEAQVASIGAMAQ